MGEEGILMVINNITSQQPNTSVQSPLQSKPTQEKDNTPGKFERVDEYIPSEKQESVVYKKPTNKVDAKTIEQLKAESELHHRQLIDMVRRLVEKQGFSLYDVLGGNAVVPVDAETRAAAQAAIDEGGHSSVENVSDRIVNFAIAVSGGDPGKLEGLKASINEGFEAAAEVFGGKLPEISYQTHERIMEKLDAWAAQGQPDEV